jgi:hypothetical protein
MTRRKLTYGKYCAIVANTSGGEIDQTNLRQVYSLLRTSQYCNAKEKLDPRFELRCDAINEGRYQGHTCQLFAVNGGKGISAAHLDASSGPPISFKQKMANYSLVLVTNGCELMDNCITQMEDELGFMENNHAFGYSDDEIRHIIETRLR